MEERYHATKQNRFYPYVSNVNKNITVEAKLISPPTYFMWSNTLYVSDGLSVHHQVFKTVNRHMSNRYYRLIANKQLAVSVCKCLLLYVQS